VLYQINQALQIIFRIGIKIRVIQVYVFDVSLQGPKSELLQTTTVSIGSIGILPVYLCRRILSI